MMRLLAGALLAACLLVVSPATLAHGGEDHGAPPPVISQGVAPRASAASEDFEVVAVLEDKKLVLYVDRFASNEPLANAKVELEGAGLKGLAGEVAPGTYAIDVAASIPPARHPLVISIEAGDTADLLSATLDTSAAVEPHVHAPGWSAWTVWIVAALLLLASGVLLLVRRRRERSGES